MMAGHIQAGHCRTSRQALFGGFVPFTLLWRCLVIAPWLAIAWPASAAGERLPGKFVWAELVTYDIALSEKFYGPLFGWEFEDHDGYRVAWRGEEPVGGLVHRPRRDPEGQSRWIAYMSVENMEAAKATLKDAGAQLLADSRQVSGLGELAVFADTEGALFGVIQGAGPDPADYLAGIGDWIWIQLFSRNAGLASAFYEWVGGYQRFDSPRAPGSYMLAREGYARAAISTIPPRYPDASPAWVPFLRVANMAATLAMAHALGGQTLVAPRPDLYDNRVAIIKAPDGSAVGILVWAAADKEGSRCKPCAG